MTECIGLAWVAAGSLQRDPCASMILNGTAHTLGAVSFARWSAVDPLQLLMQQSSLLWPATHLPIAFLLQEDLCSFFNALMTCSGAQLDSGTSVLNCSITRDKGPPYAFLKMRSVQEASNALAFNGIQFRGSTLKVRQINF